MNRRTMYRRNVGRPRLFHRTRRYIGGRRDPFTKMSLYIDRLKKLYPLCKHDSDIERQVYDQYSGHKITYGEMTYEGLEVLYRHVLQFFTISPSYFFDIGSGRGKLCLYMAAKPNIKTSIGVELVSARYEDSVRLRNALLREFSEFTNKVLFLNENVLEVEFEDIFTTSQNPGPAFVWFSNLCFDTNVTDSIYAKLVSELPSGSVICSSKVPNAVPENVKNLGAISVPMSWSQQSTVYIFQTTKNQSFSL